MSNLPISDDDEEDCPCCGYTPGGNPCPDCDGDGFEWGTNNQTCGTCKGDGYCPECN